MIKLFVSDPDGIDVMPGGVDKGAAVEVLMQLLGIRKEETACNGDGEPWFDGLIYETIRGISDLLASSYDEELDHRVDDIIERFVRAQAAGGDGYIDTYTTLDRPGQRWDENGGFLRWQHDHPVSQEGWENKLYRIIK